jgi:hypothetical protein
VKNRPSIAVMRCVNECARARVRARWLRGRTGRGERRCKKGGFTTEVEEPLRLKGLHQHRRPAAAATTATITNTPRRRRRRRRRRRHGGVDGSSVRLPSEPTNLAVPAASSRACTTRQVRGNDGE